jgi:hypothetical protein
VFEVISPDGKTYVKGVKERVNGQKVWNVYVNGKLHDICDTDTEVVFCVRSILKLT